jgi:hypothetical protein
MGPVYSLKVVRPLRVAPVSFEQVLSNKLHSTLVIQPSTSKKVSAALLSSKLAKPTKPLHQPSLADASDVKSKIATLLHTSNSVTASHTMSRNNSIIVQGTCKKKHILMAYQERFGSEYPELNITRKKGKISDNVVSRVVLSIITSPYLSYYVYQHSSGLETRDLLRPIFLSPSIPPPPSGAAWGVLSVALCSLRLSKQPRESIVLIFYFGLVFFISLWKFFFFFGGICTGLREPPPPSINSSSFTMTSKKNCHNNAACKDDHCCRMRSMAWDSPLLSGSSFPQPLTRQELTRCRPWLLG